MANKNPYAEHVTLARLQLKRLDNAARKFMEMSGEWEDLDGGMVAELTGLAEKVSGVKSLLNELKEECRNAREWN
ncbi:hypothetical protein EHW65_07940 [Erwinia psidii]|uniref:hypothetical protein n=1 Tax=Erwinia psidii TaxID=69224 RepID=UPI00226B1153|nr:hypothetical protein [Erwinia psidii]MCX8957202.1 hypothetical protein [Erwinia psidii]